MGLFITGGRVVDPGTGLDGFWDILVVDGKISEIIPQGEKHPSAGPHEIYDAKGKIVAPGFIDIHVHLREPGQEYKETIKSGSEAAARGGFTTVCCMPNTTPPNDCAAVTKFILHKAGSEAVVNVLPIGAVSQGLGGKAMAEYGDLAEAGVVALSDDGHPVVSSQLMRLAMEYSRAFGLTIIDHCEDPLLSAGGVVHEGMISTLTGLKGIPAAAEEAVVARDILLSGLTGARLHIAHVSTAGSVRMIREAKARGISVTAEVTPHHFTLTEDAVRNYDTRAKVNPPLRTQVDVAALKEGLADGTLDAIASDHAPHSLAEKEVEFDMAAFGISGLEVALPLSLNLVRDEVLSLPDLIARMTSGPARVLGLRHKGTLAVGSDADITILNLNREWTVDVREFRSRGKNTPFQGWTMKGCADVIVGGKPVRL